jgi:hypothetical protein
MPRMIVFPQTSHIGKRRQIMLKTLTGFALAGLTAISLASFSGGTAKAQGFSIEFGNPGYHDNWNYRSRYRDYGYDRGECRVVVQRHINRRGERVVVRKRICD